MNEAEWLTCEDTAQMLQWAFPSTPPNVLIPPNNRSRDRKLLLFASAVYGTLTDFMLEYEQLPGRDPGEQIRNMAVAAVEDSQRNADHPRYIQRSRYVSYDASTGEWVDLCPMGVCVSAMSWVSSYSRGRGVSRIKKWPHILRDILGNPWQSVDLSSEHVTPDVFSLAQAAYNNSFEGGSIDEERLLVLADALEDSGCDSDRLLRHLRGEEDFLSFATVGGLGTEDIPPTRLWRKADIPHVRGCWALDLVLGMERYQPGVLSQ